jgi:hypothetical protein
MHENGGFRGFQLNAKPIFFLGAKRTKGRPEIMTIAGGARRGI